MFNLEWLKNLIKPYPTPEEPTLDERIAKQVASLVWDADCNHKLTVNRLTRLEAHVDGLRKRSESVDAFYVKTVTQALSESQAKHYHALNEYVGAINSNLGERLDKMVIEQSDLTRRLHEELSTNLARTGALEAKLAALVSKLRAGLE